MWFTIYVVVEEEGFRVSMLSEESMRAICGLGNALFEISC